MKVLLINPTKERLFEQPSLGLLYIGSALLKAGHGVTYLEGSGEKLNFQVFLRLLKADLKPDVIGFTVMSPMFNEVKGLVDMIMRECYDRSIEQPLLVAGGAHATLMPETLIKIGMDYVVQGEGEKSIVKLLDPEGSKAQHIIPPDPTFNLDELAFPARKLLPKKYLKRHSTNIMASRGCPYNCIFCQPTLRKMFGSQVRKRTPKSIIAEMKECFYDLGIQYFEFFDDTFTANKLWVHIFCELLSQTQITKSMPIRWECLTRVNAIDEDLLLCMKAAGCHRITFGVESGSQEILDYYRKGITVEQIKEAFRLCHKVGIHSHALFMMGAPMESERTIAETEQLIREIKPDSLFVSITTPLPYTDLWDDLNKTGSVTLDWSQIDYYHKPALKLQYLTPEDVIQARERILKNFYLKHPGYVLKLLKARGWSYTNTAIKNLFGAKSK